MSDDHVLTDTTFESFQLHPLLQQGLADSGFTRCTPIQALSLPLALAGKDLAGQAQTGTGKTCAFLVALMNHLLTTPARASRRDTDPRALVVAPTRELAIQIDKDARALAAHTGLEIALIYGGVDYDKQRQMLRDGCDIIIATPGRMLDYHKQQVFRMDNVEVMVLDEADRMFDLGFIKDVRYIFHRLPVREERQVLLYSATLSQRVLELAYEHMNDAQKLVVEADHVTADKVRQVVYFPAKEEKLPLLLNLIKREQPTRALVFVNTRAQVERVRTNLRRHGYKVGALSGDVPQDKRQRVLKQFKADELEMLVCTDVAARGLHIPHVSHVFNYDLPQDAEDYVHRVGRTARLGEEGDAISFACDLYAMSLPEIETYIEQKIPVAAVEPELLVMPKPVHPEIVEHARAPRAPRGRSGGAGSGRSRRGSGGRGASGHGGATDAGQRQQAATAASAAPAPASAASTPAPAAADGANGANGAATTTTDGSPAPRRRRRHRGGRKHRTGTGAGTATQGRAPRHQGEAGAAAPAPASARGNGRARNGSVLGNGTRTPAASRPAAPAAPKANGKAAPSRQPGSTQVQARAVGQGRQDGFFKRLARGLFGGGK